MEYQAVLFDFDYTLGDATEAIVAGFTHAFSHMGHPIPSREEVRGTRHFPMQGPEERERGARHAALPRAGAGGAGRGAGHAALPCGARGAERTSL